jgi:hypothetical protein
MSVNQIRKQQRMRRETVVAAMLPGELPDEQRGPHPKRTAERHQGVGGPLLPCPHLIKGVHLHPSLFAFV